MISLGAVADIDLTTGAVAHRPVSMADTELVLGGRGANVLRLVREGAALVDPLSPENPLLISLGLLTGSEAPSSPRVYISARSPLTGALGGASVGGSIGHALRTQGVTSLALHGRSAKRSYLLIEGGRATLHDAADLWGLDTTETAQRLLARHDEGSDPERTRLGLLVIGPAGEQRVPLAALVTGGGHTAGRTGLGAVMGDKLLKAIVIVPSRPGERPGQAPPEADDRAAARAAVKRFAALLKAAPGFDQAREFGTTDSVLWSNANGMLPTRNFTAATFDGAAATDGTAIERYVVHTHGCPGCTIRCKAAVRVPSGPHAEPYGQRPDFEPLVAWGAKVGLDDPEAVLFLHDLCDRLGLDSISAGAAAAFALDLFARGIITAADTDGRELHWGDADALAALLEDMAAGRGFGGLLGGGVRRAARAIGRGAERFAYEVKGMELTAYDPRGAFGAALSAAVAPRGADFTSVYARQEFALTPDDAERLYGDARAADPVSPGGKAALVRAALLASATVDSLGMCKIAVFMLLNDYGLEATAALAQAVAGLPLSSEQLLLAGERVATLERLFDVRCGIHADDDLLPRAFTVPLADGPHAGSAVDVTGMRDEFYRRMGWSPEGVPTASTLERLGLTAFSSGD